jgi:hypothetical protein
MKNINNKFKEQKGDRYIFEIDTIKKMEVSYTLQGLNVRKNILESRISKCKNELELINSLLNKIDGKN